MLRYSANCFSILFLVACFGVLNALGDCSFDTDSHHFELGALQRKHGYTKFMNGYEYRFDICRNCQGSCQLGDFIGCDSVAPGYQYSPGDGCKTMGNLNDAKAVGKGEIIVENIRCETDFCLGYLNGDECPGQQPGVAGPKRSLIFNFKCGKAYDPPGEVRESPSAKCNYMIDWETKAACPKPKGMSWGWKFVISYVCAAVLYFGGFFCYNVRVLGMEPTVEALPHIEFWRGLPGLVLEGINHFKDRVRQYKEGYQNMNGGDSGNSDQQSHAGV